MAVDLDQPRRDAEHGLQDSNSEGEHEKSQVTATVDPLTPTESNTGSDLQPVPLKWKLTSILMVILIGFGSQWSSGITGAMKTTLKKELNISNTQFSLLEASEDFMITALMMVSGVVTDRIGGLGAFAASLAVRIPY